MRFYKILVILLATLTIFGCRKDIDGEITQITLEPNTPYLEDTGFSGLILDEKGNPIENAVVDFTSFRQNTDENGYFKFDNISFNQLGSLITIDKEGYYRGFRFVFPEKSNHTNFKLIMIEKKPQGEFDAATGGTVETEFASVSFIPNSIKVESTGEDYEGTVLVDFHWYNTQDPTTLLSMPGDLRAIDAKNNLRALASYGMMAVELRGENEQKLNLKENNTATISMVAPDLAELPESMPLWSLDEENGYWIEDGICTLQDGFYIGEVSHFSFWNCDAPFDLVNINGTIEDLNGEPISNALIKVTIANAALSGYAYTNDAGEYSGKVPKGVDLNYVIYNECGTEAQSGSLGNFVDDAEIPTIVVQSELITTTITGLVLCNGNPLSNGYVKIEYTTGIVTLVNTNSDGSFEANRLLCAFTGEEINVVAINDELELMGEPTSYNIDQTGMLDIGTIDACTLELEEWINITINNDNMASIYTVGATFGVNGLMLTTTDSMNTRIEFNINDPQIGDQNPYQSFFSENLSNQEFRCTNSTQGFECGAMNIKLEDITKQVDGFIIGTFSGILFSEVQETVEITGDFQIKLDSYTPNAVVRGNIWNDEDGNGLQDPDEGVFFPYSIFLNQNGSKPIFCDQSGAFITHVAANQTFLFSNDLSLHFPTIQNAGDDTIDSDFNPQGDTENYTLEDGEYLENIGLGLISSTELECEISPSGEVTFCDGTTILLEAFVISGSGPYDYNWNNGVNDAIIEVADEGLYSVTVTDANGFSCISEVAIFIDNGVAPDPVVINATCGMSNGSIDFSSIGDIIEIQWPDLSSSELILTDLAPGSYFYQGLTQEGCEIEGQVEILNLEGRIGNQVWIDMPGGTDGQFDAGDQGIGDIQINLYDAQNDEIVMTTFTEGLGNYLFSQVEAGDYYVEFIIPMGYEFIDNTAEIFEQNGSDPDPETGLTKTFTIACGETILSIDAGLREI